MHEPRPWDDSDERLHELQEKFNAYVSFLLDGEMIAAHPELAGKPARIELRCDYMPDERALALLNLIHDQIALQEIKMEVIVAERGLLARAATLSSRAETARDLDWSRRVSRLPESRKRLTPAQRRRSG